jgi:hypothetical protein
VPLKLKPPPRRTWQAFARTRAREIRLELATERAGQYQARMVDLVAQVRRLSRQSAAHVARVNQAVARLAEVEADAATWRHQLQALQLRHGCLLGDALLGTSMAVSVVR